MSDELGQTLIDEASKEDQFTGGGHKRTAEQLTRSILTFSEHSKNRAIGLYGEWGSGKTTVVNLAEKNLAEQYSKKKCKKFRFFTFDLWSANTKHFKRTLLEELIDWGKTERGDQVPDLKKLQDIVRDRKITTTSDLSLKFSRLGIAFFAFLPLIPIIYSWLGPEAFSYSKTVFEISWLKPYVGDWLWNVTGWKLALIPLSALFSCALLSVLHKWLSKKSTLNEAISHVLSLVTHKEKTNTVTQNIREKDPNEHEFDNLFCKILGVIQNDGSKVVLVFDNIDRLHDEDLIDYWALVRSVFSSSNVRPAAKGQTCIAIVPYVPQAITRSFSNDQGGDDVFAKTFDVRHRVAQPIFSNVAEFLSLKIDERFKTEIEPEQKNALGEIFAFSLRQSGSATVTPRGIITFVNEVADLYAVWSKNINIAYIAIYVQNREEIERNPSVLQHDESNVKKYFRFDRSYETLKYLAALAFNVEPDLAYQTLLMPELLEALANQDSKKIEALERVEGFSQVLKQAVQHHARTVAADDGLHSLSILAKCVSRASEDESQTDQFARDILAAIPDVQTQKLWDLKNIEHLQPILELLGKSQVEDVVPIVAELLGKPIGEEPSYENGRAWSYAVHRTLEYLKSSGFDEGTGLSSYFDKARGANFALGVASTSNAAQVGCSELPKIFAASDLKDAFLARAGTDIRHVSSTVEGLIEASKFTADISTSLLAFLKSGLVDAVVEDVKIYVDWTRAFSDVYRLSVDASGTKKKRQLDQLVGHGAFIWHIHKFCSSGKNDELLVLSLELSLISLADKDFGIRFKVEIPIFGSLYQSTTWFLSALTTGAAGSDEVLSSLADRCGAAYLRHFIMLARSNMAHAALASAVLGKIASSTIYTGCNYVSYIASQEDWLRANHPKLLGALVRDSKDDIDSKKLDEIDLDEVSISLLRDGCDTGGEGWLAYDKAVAAKFKEFDERAWTEILSDGGNAAELLDAKFEGLGEPAKINSTNLQNPLEQHYLGVLEGTQKPPSSLGDRVFLLVGDAILKTIVKAIATKFSTKSFTTETVQSAHVSFPRTTEQVLENDAFERSADVVITKLVASKDDQIIGFLEQNSAALGRLVAKFGSDSKAALVESFQSWYGETSAQDKVKELVRALGLQIELPETATVADDEGNTSDEKG